MAGTAQPMGQTQIPTSPLATKTTGNYRPPINTLGQRVGKLSPYTGGGMEAMPLMGANGREKFGAVNSVTGETIPIQPWQQEPGVITMYGGGVGRSNLTPEALGGGLPVAPPPISALPKGGGGMYSGEQYAGLDMSGFNPRPQMTMDMSPYTLNGKTYHGSSSWASELQDYLNSTGQGDAFGRPEQNSLRQTSFSPSLTQRKF